MSGHCYSSEFLNADTFCAVVTGMVCIFLVSMMFECPDGLHLFTDLKSGSFFTVLLHRSQRYGGSKGVMFEITAALQTWKARSIRESSISIFFPLAPWQIKDVKATFGNGDVQVKLPKCLLDSKCP